MKTLCAIVGAFFLFAAIAALVVAPSGRANGASASSRAFHRESRPLLLQAAAGKGLPRDAVTRSR